MLKDIKEMFKGFVRGTIEVIKSIWPALKIVIYFTILIITMFLAFRYFSTPLMTVNADMTKEITSLTNDISKLNDKVVELEKELESANKEINDISKTVVKTEDKIAVKPTPVQKPVSSGENNIDIYVSEISEKYGMPVDLINSIIWHESRFNPNATNGNCVGLMQICTRWHQERASRLGVTDFFDPYGSILVGVDYIHELYKNNGNDYGLALMLYNMDHASAYKLHRNGQLSKYATSVLTRANMN